MPTLRGKGKLKCHYCGQASKQSKNPDLRQWDCENCEATNWLDENGEITDPPVSAVSSSRTARYGTKISFENAVDDPISASAPDTLFCTTCQKNQHLYTQSLASFYPPTPTDTNLEEYEKAEKEYREGLEERYPLICEDCEPRVRAKLKKANYAAKVDHMKVVMEKLKGTRGRIGSRRRTGSLLWLFGLVWGLGWACQVLWSLLAILLPGNTPLGSPQRPEASKATVPNGSTFPQTVEDFRQILATYGLLFGAASCWWHPRMSEKLDKRLGKTRNQGKYYGLSAIALAVRFAAYHWRERVDGNGNDPQHSIHALLLFLSLSAIWLLCTTVSIDTQPCVNMIESPEPLIKHRKAHVPQISSRHRAPTLPRPPFSIDSLAPQPPEDPLMRRLPTPPPEAYYNDPNAMDWQPVQPPLNIHRSQQPPPQPQSPQPSPFHGRLPANVYPPAHRLRNPYSQPTIIPASAAKKASLFSRPPTTLTRRRDTGHPLDLNPLSTALDGSPSSSTNTAAYDPNEALDSFGDISPTRRTPFAHPTFFPASDSAETGLEDTLGRAFGINDRPAEVRKLAGQENEADPSSVGPWRMFGGNSVPVPVPMGTDEVVSGREVAVARVVERDTRTVRRLLVILAYVAVLGVVFGLGLRFEEVVRPEAVMAMVARLIGRDDGFSKAAESL